jgi:hypothetical protein
MFAKKEPGFYWVKCYKDSAWTIGEVDMEGYLYIIGSDEGIDEVYEWGEKITPPKPYRSRS